MTNTIIAIILAFCLSGILIYFTYKAIQDIIEIKNRNNFKFLGDGCPFFTGAEMNLNGNDCTFKLDKIKGNMNDMVFSLTSETFYFSTILQRHELHRLAQLLNNRLNIFDNDSELHHFDS